jgi:hypothetical protein
MKVSWKNTLMTPFLKEMKRERKGMRHKGKIRHQRSNFSEKNLIISLKLE